VNKKGHRYQNRIDSKNQGGQAGKYVGVWACPVHVVSGSGKWEACLAGEAGFGIYFLSFFGYFFGQAKK